MIQIYKWQTAEESATVTTVDPNEFQLLTPFGNIESVERVAKLRIVEGSDAGNLNDFLYSGDEQPRVLSARALSALEIFLKPNGLLTPVIIEGISEEYFAFTPKKVIDCIDEEASLIRETTYVRFIERAAFKPTKFNPTDVFVARGFEKDYIWVTDAFVETVLKHGLVGAEFN